MPPMIADAFPDAIHHPFYYNVGAIECIDAIQASMSAEAFKGFIKGNCMKYLYRYENKNGVEDLKKAEWYLLHLITILNNENQLPVVPSNPDGYMTKKNNHSMEAGIRYDKGSPDEGGMVNSV